MDVSFIKSLSENRGCALLAVMLSAAKHLLVRREMLHGTQHDSQQGAPPRQVTTFG